MDTGVHGSVKETIVGIITTGEVVTRAISKNDV